MSLYFDQVFSMYQCGFREGINSHYCLPAMLEKWRLSKDKDISEVFDCLLHDFLKAKLIVYISGWSVLKSINIYLCYRKQRTKISMFYSLWQEVLNRRVQY